MTDKLIYVHLPKTGGSWVSYVLRVHLGGVHIYNGHDPAWVVPPDLRRERLVFGSIRDPWSWYISWWRHALAFSASATTRMGRGGAMNFHDVLWGLLHPKDIPDMPEKFSIFFPLNPPGDYRESFRKSKVGLYSWLFQHMFFDPATKEPIVQALVHTAKLREGLELLTGEALPETKFPPQNTRFNRSSTADLGPNQGQATELSRWVWEADGEIARRLGYTEPGVIPKEPIARLDQATSIL